MVQEVLVRDPDYFYTSREMVPFLCYWKGDGNWMKLLLWILQIFIISAGREYILRVHLEDAMVYEMYMTEQTLIYVIQDKDVYKMVPPLTPCHLYWTGSSVSKSTLSLSPLRPRFQVWKLVIWGDSGVYIFVMYDKDSRFISFRGWTDPISNTCRTFLT